MPTYDFIYAYPFPLTCRFHFFHAICESRIVNLIDMINNKAMYNQINAKYQQMAYISVPTNPYLESLVKQN